VPVNSTYVWSVCTAQVNKTNHYVIVTFTMDPGINENPINQIMNNESQPYNLQRIKLATGGSELHDIEIINKDYSYVYALYQRCHRDIAGNQGYMDYDTFINKGFSVCMRVRDILVSDRNNEYTVTATLEPNTTIPANLRMNVLVIAERAFTLNIDSGASTLEG
jgi:hypothetical protein